MNTIPTAEDFLLDYDQEYFAGEVFGDFAYKSEQVTKAMIDFAKLHVKAALEKASKVEVFHADVPGFASIQDVEGILNSYKEDEII